MFRSDTFLLALSVSWGSQTLPGLLFVGKEFVVSISHTDEVTGNVHVCFFLFGRQHSRYQMLKNAAHVQHINKNTMTTSYGNSNLWCYLVRGFPSVTSHNPSHTLNVASFIGVDGRPLLGSLSTLSRPIWKRLCHSYTRKIFIALSLHPCCNMVNVSAGHFYTKTHSLMHVHSSTRHFQHQHNHTHTKQTNKCCYSTISY